MFMCLFNLLPGSELSCLLCPRCLPASSLKYYAESLPCLDCKGSPQLNQPAQTTFQTWLSVEFFWKPPSSHKSWEFSWDGSLAFPHLSSNMGSLFLGHHSANQGGNLTSGLPVGSLLRIPVGHIPNQLFPNPAHHYGKTH